MSAHGNKRKKVRDEVIRYLNDKNIAVLSWTSPDDAPQSATIYYWINDLTKDDFNVYFVTRRSTRKFACLRERPRVALVIGTELEPHTVQIEGIAQLAESANEFSGLEETIERLKAHVLPGKLYVSYFPKSPFSGLKGTDFAVFRIKPTWVRYMTYNDDTNEIEFHQIVP